MRMIISPAKTMKVDSDTMPHSNDPQFLHKTKEIVQYLQSQTYDELKTLWGCNDTLAQLNYERVQKMDLERNVTPALLSYEGIQYQYMAPIVFENNQWQYIQEHLRILSGFYGMVRPFDGVVPYRLEMQAKAKVQGKKDLYEFWGDCLYEQLKKETDCIVNLASKEYSKCIEKYRIRDQKEGKPVPDYITCVFAEEKQGKLVQKATLAKMARGEMVRFLAEREVQNIEEIKQFQQLGFEFSEKHSKKDLYTFVKMKTNENSLF